MTSFAYFDYAAATPMDASVRAAMEPYASERFFNPSATYLPAKAVRQDIEAARGVVAHWLGARPAEVVFTAGGTEANNLAIHGVMQQFPEGNVVVSAIEHESVLAAAHRYDCREAAVNDQGIVNVADLIALINQHTVLVSVMYANNEVGTIQPIRELAQAVEVIRKERRAQGNKLPLYLHTDAAQAAAYLDLHVSRLGVDMLTLNAGKIYGPKQVGVLYMSSQVRLKPQVYGGGQERGWRSGTENVAGVVGLATALALVQERRHDEVQRLKQLQQLFLDLLTEQLPKAVLNGSRTHRLPNNIHLTIPGTDNERLLIQLETEGVLAAAGSACSASNEEPSHVLKAMGIGEQDAQASLRFTMGFQTTEHDIRQAVDGLKKCLPAG